MRTSDRTGLDALARARPDALDPARLAGSPRQHEDLVSLLSTQPARTSRSRGARSRRRVLVPAIGAAAVIAVAVGTVVITQHTAPAPTHNGVASATEPGNLVLLSMANSAQNQAQQGAYWQQRTQSGTLDLVTNAAAPYVLASVEQEQWSIGVQPGEQSLLITGLGSTTKPRTAQDRRRWQDAGSPNDVDVDMSQELRGKTLFKFSIGSGHPQTMRTDYDGDIVAVGPNNVNYAYLQQLPADQQQLTRLLGKLFQESGTDAAQLSSWMFEQVSNLITFPVSSAVRASAYRILASLPGITSLGKVTDPLGRTGIGLALPGQTTGDLGAQAQQLIVDPNTSTILCQQTVLTQPSKPATLAGLTEGTVVNYTATTDIGWTDQPVATTDNH